MKQIKLTQGQFAIVDDLDYEELSKYRWYASRYKKVWYAERSDTLSTGKRCVIRMHRQILGFGYKDGNYVDHKNNNGLDNQRTNLRSCTQTQNCYNKRHQESKSSIYKGVSWCKTRLRWRACITHKNKQKFLGYFDFEKLAAEAYNKAAEMCFGDFACLNQIQRRSTKYERI